MSYLFIILLFPFFAFSQNIATFSSADGSVKNVSLKEVKQAYQVVLNSTLNAPTRTQFVKDYVRYRVIVEEAYNDRSLVKSAKVRNSIVDSELRQALDQSVYKTFISKRMQAQLSKIDREVRNASNKALQAFYRANPYFNIHFIVLNIPQSADKAQISEIRKRAMEIHSKVLKSKKPFVDLVPLYSDNTFVGRGDINYSRTNLYPLVYDAVRSLKKNQITKPIRTPNGFYIIKLNRVVPFKEANVEDVKNQMRTEKRTKVFNEQLNKIQKKYKVRISNKLIKSI
ncbi:MAG: peptidylprolyl isomerase [Bdellovibrionales bacterium]|nr:peptidylprolyl isomerase [Bdellovibrionales bacterium]